MEPFEDVTDTALWVAAYRAIESERPDALFRDPLAARLAGERGRELARTVVGSESFAWAVVVRTRMLDDWIQAAIAESKIDTVLNVGAGLDTRPYRLALPSSLRWIEIDQPRILAHKRDRLAGEQPSCKLERIEADLSRHDERVRALSRVSGNVLALTEGVVGYLTNEAVLSLARDLRECGASFWLVDYSSPMLRAAIRRRRGVRADFRNAPMIFNPPSWESFFAREGWRLVSMRYHVQEGERLGRPVPLPWWFRALAAVAPSRAAEARRMMGFGWFERR